MSIDPRPKEESGFTRILIVDDSAETRELMIRRLNAAGYANVLTAESACDAFQILGMLDQPHDVPEIDLILMDISLPGIDGIEACRRITSAPRLRNIPILIVSAHNGSGYPEAAFEAGATDYVCKSTIRVELEPKVRSALAMKQASGQHPSLKDRKAAPAGPRTRT